MKTIENLTIKATYYVGFGNLEIPDEVYEGLCKIYDDNCREISITTENKDIWAALEWLTDNIKERDAYDFNYELVDF